MYIMDELYAFIAECETNNKQINKISQLPDIFPAPEVVYIRSLLEEKFKQKFTYEKVEALLEAEFGWPNHKKLRVIPYAEVSSRLQSR